MATFREKMKANIANKTGMIFTEDLKVILHLMENTPEDIELLQKMLQKYNNQDGEMRFGTYRFGPVIMRALYYLNDPDTALAYFKNPDHEALFDQVTSFMILLDLLYENNRHIEIREVYDKIRIKFANGVKHPKLALNVVAASCFKDNTPESFLYAKDICKEMIARGTNPIRRIVTTFAALALEQNAPHVALELITLVKSGAHISIRTIKIMALADLDKIDEIKLEFQGLLDHRMPMNARYFNDAVSLIVNACKKILRVLIIID